MYHPDLEKKLEELRAQRVEAVTELRELANTAIENADKTSKTMMMYLESAGIKENCVCTGKLCLCATPKKPTRKLIKKFKEAIKGITTDDG